MIRRYIIAVIAAMLVGVFSARATMTGNEVSKRFTKITATPMPANVQIAEMTEWNFVKGSIFGVSAGVIVFLLLYVIQRKTSNKAPEAKR